MKSIVIIGCYFGKLRTDTSIFIQSLKANSTIDWLIFSDCDWESIPFNVTVIRIGFDELKRIIQSKYDFPISLDAPYKLCDFKPAYGDIFSEYIQRYDFWGHCDFDMVFGDLRHFLTDSKLEAHNRIYYQGHLSIYKNDEKTCKLYQSDQGTQYYKNVFTTPRICVFDEVDGMYPIFVKEKMPIYTEVEYIDVYPYLNLMLHPRQEYRFSKFYPHNYRKQIFGYQDGHIYKWYQKHNQVFQEEYAYIHFSHKQFTPINAPSFYFTKEGLKAICEEKEIPYEIYHAGLDELKMNIAELVFRFRRKLAKMRIKRV